MSTPKNAVARETRRKSVSVVAVAAIALTLAACGSDEPAEPEPGGEPGGETAGEQEGSTQDQLYQEAIEAGGTLNVFIGSSGTEELDMLRDFFNESYPDVRLEWISGTGDAVTERLLTEKRAGLNNADVLNIPGVRGFRAVDEEGYIEHYVPEDADLFTYDPNGFIEGVAYAHSQYAGAACYNPTNVTDEEIELLQTYEGWTDPVFEGRAAITNANGFGYRRTLSYYVYENEDLGWSWMEGLAALNPVVFNSANTSIPQMIAGEYDVVYNAWDFNQVRAADDGAPVECVAPSPAPATAFAAGVVKDAPNMPAAKLYVNWLLSEDGQMAVQESLVYGARREGLDVPIENAIEPPEEVHLVDEDVLEENYPELVTRFEELFGGAAA